MIEAKPGISLTEHTIAVLNYAVKEFKKAHISLVINIPKQELFEAIVLSCAFHDLGKGVKEFSFSEKKNFSHALASAVLANSSLPESPLKDYIIFAILGHHGTRSKDLFSNHRNQKMTLKLPDLIKEYDNIRNYINSNCKICMPELNLKTCAPAETIDRVLKAFWDGKGNWYLHSIILGILNLADWKASEGYKQNPFTLPNFTTKPLREFQKLSLTGKDTIITAPTGRGKTLASLNWWKSTNRKHLTYILPTVTTVEAMYETLEKEFGENTGLIHGNLSYYLYANMEISEEYHTKKFWMKHFEMPVTVATLDQLLLAGLNWGRWEPKIINIASGAVVFDELHFSQPFTFGITLEIIKKLKKLGIPICVMSATLPRYMLKKLKEVLDNPVTIRDEEGLKEKRIEIKGICPGSLTHKIVEEFDAGKKTLICCNTVKYAQELYSRLKKFVPEEELILYHGRFSTEDRIKLLNKITHDNPRVVVATQVVEISLNIDYDVLFTELAPIDSLIQRFGRVNRFGRKKGDVYLFPFRKNSRSVYDKLIVSQTLNQLKSKRTPSQEELLEIAEEVFRQSQKDIQKRIENGIAKAKYIESVNAKIFSMEISERFHDDLLREGLRSITIIPEEFRDQEMSIMELLGKQIRVPLSRDLMREITRDLEKGKGILFAKINYDSELGYIGISDDPEII
ncbi:hypothetical protein AT15_00060 [Kosmotoga arenicorallina S304]|uniref:CRISPR-associated protein Cas3 n=1 Tax=Kosmotoga arenicorallina S304 TaxID=1453497 RepID=A0A176K4A5_9BACT|nr:CRISPR-associated helicase/endonuclease Cas3 [Kosmotoga arenicorallina]OAA32507.1 hypothetical protein AT15_00060 [Kosmotoga arenicorallina S304]